MVSKTTKSIGSLQKLTRRTVMAGTSAATLGGPNYDIPAVAGGTTDETIARCAYWLALYVELDDLTKRFGALEHWLSETYGWLVLSKEEQLTRPEGEEFRQVQARMKEICDQRPIIMDEAPTLKATTPAGVLAKLLLAQQLVWPDDCPEAHDLITGCVEELSGMLPHITFRPPLT